MSQKSSQTMIADARKAAEMLGSVALAKKIAAHGFTPASMGAQAKKLSELHTQVQIAKDALARAVADLASAAREFATMWATYSNLVRALTTDVALRQSLGVNSLGFSKKPRFHRASRSAPATPPEPQPTNGAGVPHT